MNKSSKKVLSQQKKLLLAIGAAVLLVAFGVGYLMLGDLRTPPAPPLQNQLDLPADKMNPQDIWMTKLESQNSLFDQKLGYLEGLVLETKKQEHEAEKEKRALKTEIDSLKSQLQSTKDVLLQPRKNELQDPFSHPVPVEAPPPATLIEFTMEESPSNLSNVATTIPAGTSVKALLVSSVDAGSGVYSIHDPIPVKLRILDDGHLPKNVDVNLKGGIVIGSAYGNLSSERIYMRLERLTQVNPKGDFVETSVAGYVTGEDGKYGIRGTVVDKSEKIITNAAVSGLFGEASDILQSALGRLRVENTLNANQSAQTPYFSSHSGNSNAFDMLADYYIKRAEQIEPVIQVNAGRIVDITFTHGVEIGELNAQEKVKEVREKHRECP